MADIAKLKAHLAADPDLRGFDVKTNFDVAVDLKVVFKSRDRTSMSGREVRSHITDDDWDGITDPEKKTHLLALLSSDDLDPFGFAANVVKDILGASDTLTALIAARVEIVSAEIFYDLGNVRDGDVGAARA